MFRARTSNPDTNIAAGNYQPIGIVTQTPEGVQRVDTVDYSEFIKPGYFISYKVVAVDFQGLQSEISDPEGEGIPDVRWGVNRISSDIDTIVSYPDFLWDHESSPSELAERLDISVPLNIEIEKNPTGIRLIPNPLNFIGQASFVLTVRDSIEFWDCDTIIIYIVNQDTNLNPIAVDNQITTYQNQAVIFNPLINDSDPDGDSIFVVEPFPLLPQHGTVELLNGSSIRYTPDIDYIGQDNFDYQVRDARGGRDTATVNVTVLPVETVGENTIAFPNPVKVSEGQTTVVFEPIPADAQELWLISPALGNIVYKKVFNGAPPSRLELSLLDDDLKDLSSGLYIYLIKGDGDKKLKSGKIAIIR
ncbi:MAG: hypothetical protein A2Y94_00490 [Caldithrix sp. RBG_13_44_9]|nr:MAG: hypothetical protein A2Y94_00490 [Caldithrix sp. RBG_13_44_9]